MREVEVGGVSDHRNSWPPSTVLDAWDTSVSGRGGESRRACYSKTLRLSWVRGFVVQPEWHDQGRSHRKGDRWEELTEAGGGGLYNVAAGTQALDGSEFIVFQAPGGTG